MKEATKKRVNNKSIIFFSEVKKRILYLHRLFGQHNNQLAPFRIAVLWPITQNVVGGHICHFVIDRLLFTLQPSHRAVKKLFNADTLLKTWTYSVI